LYIVGKQYAFSLVFTTNQSIESFMLSRRNIRIKVMQLLYSMNRDSALTYVKAEITYNQKVKISYNTYLYNLYLFQKIANYSKKDEETRKSKHLPSDEDRNFSAILATNPLMDSFIRHEGFHERLNREKLMSKVDMDIIRKIYQTFAETDEYKKYVYQKSHTDDDHKTILLSLYRFCVKAELFNESIEDHFPNWVDDDSLVIGATKKTIKGFPALHSFHEAYLPDDETVEEYGKSLLYKMNQLDEELLEVIKPALQNWDVDRVAILDMIMLKMAICEFLHFPTIPTKVTINEYIDISKMYSTPKSKDFINGILDRLLKKLIKTGQIDKQGRGLKS
jgi:N utilization substance protein B